MAPEFENRNKKGVERGPIMNEREGPTVSTQGDQSGGDENGDVDPAKNELTRLSDAEREAVLKEHGAPEPSDESPEAESLKRDERQREEVDAGPKLDKREHNNPPRRGLES